MTPAERQALLRLIYKVREMNQSRASCSCGRLYTITFDAQLTEEIDVAEAIVENIPVTWLEVD